MVYKKYLKYANADDLKCLKWGISIQDRFNELGNFARICGDPILIPIIVSLHISVAQLDREKGKRFSIRLQLLG